MQITTKMRELREKAEADLAIREKELAEQLFALRLQKVTGQLEKPSKIRGAKRELARVLTVAGEKRRTATDSAKAAVETSAKSKKTAKGVGR